MLFLSQHGLLTIFWLSFNLLSCWLLSLGASSSSLEVAGYVALEANLLVCSCFLLFWWRMSRWAFRGILRWSMLSWFSWACIICCVLWWLFAATCMPLVVCWWMPCWLILFPWFLVPSLTFTQLSMLSMGLASLKSTLRAHNVRKKLLWPPFSLICCGLIFRLGDPAVLTWCW